MICRLLGGELLRFLVFLVAVSLLAGLSGCMKAVEKPSLPAPQTKGILDGPYDAFIPAPYRSLLEGLPPADERLPELLLAVAGHFAGEGDEAKANHFLDRAEAAFLARGEEGGRALAFSRKTLLILLEGRRHEAADLLAEARRRWPGSPLAAFPLYMTGCLHLADGEIEQARDQFLKAVSAAAPYRSDPHLLTLSRDAELMAGMTWVLMDHLPLLAGLPRGTAPPADQQGRRHLEAALAMNEELRTTKRGPYLPPADYQRLEWEALAFLGLDEGARGEDEASLRHLVFAAQLARASGLAEVEIKALLFQAVLGLAGVNEEEGRRAASRLVDLADYRGAAAYGVWGRLLKARYFVRHGQQGAAAEALRQADEMLSSPLAESGPFAAVFRRNGRFVYELLVEILAGQGRCEEALLAAEKGRRLQIRDLLAEDDLAAEDAVRVLLQQIREKAAQVAALEGRILRLVDERMVGPQMRHLKEAKEAYGMLLADLERRDGRLFSLLMPRPAEAPAIQARLDNETTLFVYFAAEQALYVWAVNRHQLHLERIEMPRGELRSLVSSFVDALRNGERRKAASLARRTYDSLLKPIIPFVFGERLGFVPDDILNYLPFSALRYRGRYLVEGFSLFSLPWADMVAPSPGRGRKGMRVLAFGEPDLPGDLSVDDRGHEEVGRLRKRGSLAAVLTGELASEARAEASTSGYDILHFAVPARFDPDDPLASALLLTPGAGRDGLLTVREIFRLRYGAEAVFLSGCSAAAKEDPEGRGLSLLQLAFIQAGIPTVVSTLWPADQKGAAQLVDSFYRELQRGGTFADSLRAAQLQLMRRGHPPSVWAAFALTGRP